MQNGLATVVPLHPMRRSQRALRLVSPEIRVVIADAHTLVRAGFRVLLETPERIAIVGEATNSDAAVELARRLRPDVVMMDADLPGSVAAIRSIRAESDAAVMLLTASEGDEVTFDALRAGASGILLKDTDPTHLIQAIHLVAGGHALVPYAVARAPWLSPGAERRTGS